MDDRIKIIADYCGVTSCDECKLNVGGWENEILGKRCLDACFSPDKDIERALNIIANKEVETPKVEKLKGDNIDSVIKEIPGYDPVNRPAHYTDGKIEVIDFIEDKNLGFCLGNAVKYIARAGKKNPDKEVEDLKKASWYINRRIKELEEV